MSTQDGPQLHRHGLAQLGTVRTLGHQDICEGDGDVVGESLLHLVRGGAAGFAWRSGCPRVSVPARRRMRRKKTGEDGPKDHDRSPSVRDE